MIYEKIHLNKIYGINTDPVLEVMIGEFLDNNILEKREAILVIPGGGYCFCSKREGDPIAISFLSEGFRSFVLYYSVTTIEKKNYYPTQIIEVMCAMDYIRKNANRFGVNENKISIIGFSAGGHLAASYGYLYKDQDILDVAGFDSEFIKPNAICLGYPVITFKEYAHIGSRNNLIGDNLFLIDKLSCEEHVDKDYPITYLWTTENDNLVPSENTKLFDKALTDSNVLHKTVIYKDGPHGLSLAKDFTSYGNEKLIDKEISGWILDCIKFLKENLK